ncbi:MAG: CBS domain-containing protein [Rhodobacteraceae bacterium]|nr:CBS domain-containing protein [Paracoccaceae bacterium]
MIIRSIREVVATRHLNVIAPDATARTACHELERANTSALAVMEGDRLVGILSEKDVICKCIAGDRRSDETRVADIMTPDPITIGADARLADAMDLMVKNGFRHLPVMDGSRVLGILSMRDIPTEYRLMFERFTEYQRGVVEAQIA